MAHACNPSYSGGRDEDHRSKPAWKISSQDPISENPSQIKGGGGQSVGPEFKPQYHKKKKTQIVAECKTEEVLIVTIAV
jgi:hypothetical protein